MTSKRLFLLAAAGLLAASAMAATRVFRPARETMGSTNLIPVQEIDGADWIWSASEPKDDAAAFVRFRKAFTSDGSPLVIDVSADERFVLRLDGAFVARGPHRGFVNHWNYQTYRLSPAKGEHVLEATVAKLGRARPAAQTTWKAGFVLKASGTYDAQLTTGTAAWQAADLTGTVIRPDATSGTLGLVGGTFRVTGASWVDETPPESAFGPVRIVRRRIVKDVWGGRTPGWMLFPSVLPDQQETPCRGGAFVTGPEALRAALNDHLATGRAVTVPAHTQATLLWNLGDYYCAYPELCVDGGRGAEVVWLWDESLRAPDGKKGDRNAFAGKTMAKGFGDAFVCDGRAGARFTTPWWRAGLWCEITVRTDGEPLVIREIGLRETRYPIAAESEFACSDPSLDAIAALCRRTLENCTHETLCDCPHWEQLMYSGDTRVELELLAALTPDERPRRTAIALFDESRRGDGLPAMAVPLMEGKDSSTYAMCWVMMFGDYAVKGTDPAWLRAHLPGMRAALDALARYADADGLVAELPGWNYVDERLGNYGVPRGGLPGERPGALVNLQYLQALQGAAQAEEAAGETAMARRWREMAGRTAAAIRARFFVPARRLLAETEAHDSFTAHAQCLGVLTGVLREAEYADVAQALADFQAAGFGPMGTYFQYYLFEAAFRIGRPELFFGHLGPWRAMLAAGLRTATENGLVECRSDCHAWSASPLHFFHAGIAGVRPAGAFWSSVEVRPQPGPLTRVAAATPTPKGPVRVDLTFGAEGPEGTVTLPSGLAGTFVWGARRLPLAPGKNDIGRSEKEKNP